MVPPVVVVVPPVVVVVPPVVVPVVVVEPLLGPIPDEWLLLSKVFALVDEGTTELSFEHDVKIDVESIVMPNITVIHEVLCLRLIIIIVKSIRAFCTAIINQ